jgi:hypothetical protein
MIVPMQSMEAHLKVKQPGNGKGLSFSNKVLLMSGGTLKPGVLSQGILTRR